MDKKEIVMNAFNALRFNSVIKTQKDFANLLGVDTGYLSRALKGDGSNISSNLIDKVERVMSGQGMIPEEWVRDFPALDSSPQGRDSLPIIPIEAMAGTLGDFAGSVKAYECERMISPIKGADYAMKVCGESMSPEFPNGSQILIKKVNEKAFIEWGKVYVLDTENGAVIKKIRRTDKENIVECISLNPEFQPFFVNTAYIHGWYRVLMVLSLK